MSNGTIYIQVFPASGAVFEGTPTVSIIGGLNGPMISVPEQIGPDAWKFEGLQVGTDYMVQVQAKGFHAQQEYVSLSAGGNATASIRVYLIPSGRPGDTFPAPPGHFMLSPRAQREVEQAIKDLKSSKTSKARKHLEKALKMAPSHPRVNYLMGWSYLHDHETSKAIPYLEKSVSTDPSQLPALLALGIARYKLGDYPAAIKWLNDAIGKGLASWQAHWILAASYLRVENYEQARQHAEEALKLDNKKARRAQLVLGEALAELGLRQQAIEAFHTFLKENSHDPEAPRVREIVKKLREPVPAPHEPAPVSESSAASQPERVVAGKTAAPAFAGSTDASTPSRTTPPPNLASLVPPAPPPVPRKENWAPPDVDGLRPRIISNKACPLPSLLKRTGRTTVQWTKDLQEFTATEEYQSVEISRGGKIASPFEKQFAYMVLIRKPRPRLFYVHEMRTPEPNLDAMGAPVVAFGGPALALVFHPVYQHDYTWSCDGLGEWKGRPAWVVRFAQLNDRPTTTLESFQGPNGSRLLALKGIAWLSEKGDHVMHLETDLLKPNPSIGLERQHFSIDYELVAFRSHPVKLWLPESVDVYITLRGHSYHNYSRYSNFLLFWTGTKQVIGSVKRDHPQR